MKTKTKYKIHQKWNKEATKIQIEASNIFSLDAFWDCSEINLRKAKRRKKLANTRLISSKSEGKKSKKMRKNKMLKALSLLRLFLLEIKFVINPEAKITKPIPIFLKTKTAEWDQAKSWIW